jgi:hypothetical protein
MDRVTPIDDDDRHDCLALVYHRLGRQADAERELEGMRALDGESAAFQYAKVFAQWKKTAEALSWLAKAEQQHVPSFQSLKVDWMLDPIRNEPQFEVIEARMRFPP